VKNILAISYLFPNAERPNHGIFVFNRLKAMSKYANVTVINPIPWSPVHSFIDKFKHLANIPFKTERDGITIYHPRFFSIPGHFKGLEVVTYKQAVKNVIKQISFEFDLVDLHWTFPDLPTGDYLSNYYNVPYRVTLRGMEAFHQQDGDVRETLVAHYLSKVDSIISLSEEMADTADKIANTRSKTKVVRNGVDTDAFYYIDQAECRDKLGLPSDQKIILGVGALIHRKGFDVVIKALKKIILQLGLNNTHFYILGSEGAEGDYRKELKDLVTSLGLKDHVHFVGAVPNNELITWYNAADVFCLSSRGEGSPNVLTEALASGCPAVATNVGSVPEIMASEPNLGTVVEVDDIDAITKDLSDLLLTETDRATQAANLNKYTWDWCAKQVVEL